MAFNARMREAGHAVINGPLDGQPDEALRGIGVYRTSLEGPRRLLEGDPSVRAGRLRVGVFAWCLTGGTLGERRTARSNDPGWQRDHMNDGTQMHLAKR